MIDDDAMFDLFAHKGWRHFQAQMQEALDALRAGYDSCNTAEKFFKQQGMVQSLSNVVNFETVFRTDVDANDD